MAIIRNLHRQKYRIRDVPSPDKSKATPKCPHPPTPHHQVACPLKGVWTFNRILWHMLHHCVSEYRVSRLSCTQFGGYFHHPCVYGAGAQTRGGTHVRQALYQLSDTSAVVFFFFKRCFLFSPLLNGVPIMRPLEKAEMQRKIKWHIGHPKSYQWHFGVYFRQKEKH